MVLSRESMFLSYENNMLPYPNDNLWFGMKISPKLILLSLLFVIKGSALDEI